MLTYYYKISPKCLVSALGIFLRASTVISVLFVWIHMHNGNMIWRIQHLILQSWIRGRVFCTTKTVISLCEDTSSQHMWNISHNLWTLWLSTECMASTPITISPLCSLFWFCLPSCLMKNFKEFNNLNAMWTGLIKELSKYGFRLFSLWLK